MTTETSKKCSKCGQLKPAAAFHRQVGAPMGLRCACIECAKLERFARAEKEKEWRRGYYERTRDQKRRYYFEVAKETKSTHAAKYRAKHRDKVAAVSAKRRADKLQATPLWANKKSIEAIYAFADEFRSAGIDVHVDHIFPLRGKTVCGLHTEQNLRVCLAKVNREKGNQQMEHFQ